VLFLAVRFSADALPVGGIAKMVSGAIMRAGELMIQFRGKHTYPDLGFLIVYFANRCQYIGNYTIFVAYM
jgi:hypothetical protein